MSQRFAERKLCVEMVTVFLSEGKKFVSQSDYFGTHGLFVVVKAPLPVGDHGLISVVYDGDIQKQEIHCRFEVTHTKKTANGSQGMGLRFLDFSNTKSQMLQINLDNKPRMVAT